MWIAYFRRDAHAQRVQADEALGVCRVEGAAVLFECGDGGAYNQADAAGFIKLNALRMRIAGNKAALRRKSVKQGKREPKGDA